MDDIFTKQQESSLRIGNAANSTKRSQLQLKLKAGLNFLLLSINNTIIQLMIQQSLDQQEKEYQLLTREISEINLIEQEIEEEHEDLHYQRMKWDSSEVSQSTNYQTHASHLYSHSPVRRRISIFKVKQTECVSKSPTKNYQARPIIPFSFLNTQDIHAIQRPQIGLRLQRIQINPESNDASGRSGKRNMSHFSTPYLSDLKPIVSAANAIAIFTDESEPLYRVRPEQKKQIASLTKIMTAYTVIAICQEFGIRIRQSYIPVHSRASYMQGTTANLRSGEEILIIDLLYGLLLPSGNDAGIALAQYFGKFISFKLTHDNSSNEKNTSNLDKFNEFKAYYDQQYERQSIKLFIFQMNKYAHSLGLLDTKFVNPTGLTNIHNYSTCRDLALLTTICLKNHLLRMIFKRKVHKCEVRNDKLGYNREVIWKNTNKLLYKIKQCIGVKTGITPGAGPCLSSAFRIGSRELVVIVLNCKDTEERFHDTEKIYKWCRRQVAHSF